VNQAEIIDRVRTAGIVGAGGGGFPTYFKMNAQVNTVICNGSECEPLLATDKSILYQNPEKVIDGLKLAMQATGAKEGIIAIKGYYTKVVERVTKALDGIYDIHIHMLDNYYPAGDEFLTVYDVTKKLIPEGGLPLDVGVVVSNVLSLAQISDAVAGKTVTNRVVTINGEVEQPLVVDAPIGTSYQELIKLAGGATTKNYTVLDGGPMMGQMVEDLDRGIAKTTSGILVLPDDHFVINMKSKSITQMAKLSKAACCQCFRCTDLCPRNLLGHDIYPHRTMRTIDYNLAEPTEHITSAFLCSQCGVCEMIACDSMLLSPKKIYAEYRQQLTKQGVKSPHKKSGFSVRDAYEDRKVAIPTVMKKMGLAKYQLPQLQIRKYESKKVIIPINRHIGKPATVTTAVGDRVKIGDIIALSDDGGLGSVYHASIVGSITDCDTNHVEITA
jgi:Na+-translocating ferredoxin:NAD+ oxidoreductase RnfC subunit